MSRVRASTPVTILRFIFSNQYIHRIDGLKMVRMTLQEFTVISDVSGDNW